MQNSRQECFKNATSESSDSGVATSFPPSCDTSRYACDDCGFHTDDYHDYKDHDCQKES